MKRMGVWIGLMTKRLCKKPSFILVLALLPVVLLLYRVLITQDSGTLRVALYDAGTSEELQAVTDALTQNNTFMEFYQCESEQDLKDDVAAGRAECGYVFGRDLYENMLKKKWRGQITTVISDNTRYNAFINEVVYVELFNKLASELTVQYTIHNSGLHVTEEEIRPVIEQTYQKCLAEAVVFEFVYQDQGTDETASKEQSVSKDYLTRPIRGTVALFVLLSGLAGLIFWYQDEAEGRFCAMAYDRRRGISFGSLLLPTLLGGLVGLLCLFMSGVSMGFFREIFAMLCYCVMITGFCDVLRHVIRSVNVLCAMVPMLVIASYLCCPVLMDLGPIIPAVRYLRILLPPDYYLQCFLGRSLFSIPALAAVLIAISRLLPERT